MERDDQDALAGRQPVTYNVELDQLPRRAVRWGPGVIGESIDVGGIVGYSPMVHEVETRVPLFDRTIHVGAAIATLRQANVQP
jgi:hypothetical protein